MGVCHSRNSDGFAQKRFRNSRDSSSPLNGSTAMSKKDVAEAVPEIMQFNKEFFLQNYKLEPEILGVGTYGEVRRAYHRLSNTYRAVKIVYTHRFSEEEIDKIKREVTILMRLDHPNIVKVYESFIDKKVFYIVMELGSGGELFKKIYEQKTFTEKEAADITYQLFTAINYLHKNNVMHRDIKPENIILDDKFLKLVDFGTSQEFKKDSLVNQLEGTPYYIAPEVLEGGYNEKCDVWSAGIILYIMLSGTPPFNGEVDEEIFTNVLKAEPSYTSGVIKKSSSQAKDLLRKILIKDSKRRLSAEEVLNHPWFRVFNFKNYEIGVDVLKNIKNFNFKTRFEQNIYMFFANNVISKHEKDALTETFKKLDLNNDGVITKDELIEAYRISELAITPMDVEKLIASLDENMSGSIDYSEFIAAAWDRKMNLTDKQIKECFNILDQNGDGRVSSDEIKRMLCSKKSYFNQEWADAFNLYDDNQDKGLCFEEFKSLLNKISK